MSKETILASGMVTASDELVVELIKPDNAPQMILVRWPDHPTVIQPRRFATPRAPSCDYSPGRTLSWLEFEPANGDPTPRSRLTTSFPACSAPPRRVHDQGSCCIVP